MLSELGLLVGVMQAMLVNVAYWIVMYIIILVSCTMLFVGIASPDLLNPTCEVSDLTAPPGHPDAEKIPMYCQVCICERQSARERACECAGCVTIVL